MGIGQINGEESLNICHEKLYIATEYIKNSYSLDFVVGITICVFLLGVILGYFLSVDRIKKKPNLKLFVYASIFLLSIMSVSASDVFWGGLSSVSYFDDYSGLGANKGGTAFDGIAWIFTGYGDPTEIQIDLPVQPRITDAEDYHRDVVGVCFRIYDYGTGDTLLYDDNWEYCRFVSNSHKNLCLAESSSLTTFCSTHTCDAPGTNIYLSGYLDATARGTWDTDALVIYDCSRGDMYYKAFTASNYYIIDAKRFNCDGGPVDMRGRYGSSSTVRLENNMLCSNYDELSYYPKGTRTETCDPDHDSIYTFSKTGSIVEPCRVVSSNTSYSRCLNSNDCYQSNSCSGARNEFYPECLYNKSVDFAYSFKDYENTCGGGGYNNYTQGYNAVCSSAPDFEIRCDASFDENWFIGSFINNTQYSSCKTIPPFNCSLSNGCFNNVSCNSQGRCGECYTGLGYINKSVDCSNETFCMDDSGDIFGFENYTCQCVDRLGEVDNCLNYPPPENSTGSWSFSTCPDDFDEECGFNNYNSTFNMTCEFISSIPYLSYCVDCNTTSMCGNKYGGYDIYNRCNPYSQMCDCSVEGYNPPGCDTSGFCFGLAHGGLSCDCDDECLSGSCLFGTCTGSINLIIEQTNFITNISTPEVFSINNTIYDIPPDLAYSCWRYTGTSSFSACFADTDVINCSYWCGDVNNYNTSWNTNFDFITTSPGDYTFIVRAGNYYGDYDENITHICVRGSGYWCGENCFDNILNQDENDTDYFGECGSCDDGIKNGGETDIDYGGRCGTCFDGIKSDYVYIGNNSYPINNGEEDIDEGGRCGYCDDGIYNKLSGETMIDYGGKCGTCFDGLLNTYLNETEPDYGGHLCGSCNPSLNKTQDEFWEYSRMIDKSVPFKNDYCKNADAILGILNVLVLLIFAILVIVGVVVIVILLITIFSSLFPLIAGGKMVFEYFSKRNRRNK